MLTAIYRRHNTLQRAGWPAKRRCVWQLYEGVRTTLFAKANQSAVRQFAAHAMPNPRELIRPRLNAAELTVLRAVMHVRTTVT